MADPAKIIARVRELGANLMIDCGKLKVINKRKLPADAIEYIGKNVTEIVSWLEREGDFEERVAMIQDDGKVPRAVAEQFAKLCIGEMTKDWSELDRSWAISRCAKIIDEVHDIELARAA